jgi:hypothetical protein
MVFWQKLIPISSRNKQILYYAIDPTSMIEPSKTKRNTRARFIAGDILHKGQHA